MIYSYPRPEPYVPLYLEQDFDSSDLRTPPQVLKPRYSGDRVVERRPREFTMQQARKESEKKNTLQEASSVNGSHSKEPSSDMTLELANINDFQEWHPDNEFFTLNIRPGRQMFPFIKNALMHMEHRRKFGDDCVSCFEPLTLPKHSCVWRVDEDPQLSLRRDTLLLQRETSRFVSGPLWERTARSGSSS